MYPGERPAIDREWGGNRFGHAGDRDGIGQHGENPSRFYQWFHCFQDSLIWDHTHCRVDFRYRTNLRQGELAWVRMGRPGKMAAWLLPDSGGRWAGPSAVHFPECDSARIFVEFGILYHTFG